MLKKSDQIITQKIFAMRNGKSPRVLDLCGGAGGASLGFHTAGYDLLGSVEYDREAFLTYLHNLHPEMAALPDHGGVGPSDLTTAAPSDVLKKWGFTDTKGTVDVLLAGLPCQAFARIGRSKLASVANDPDAYRKDPRAALYLRFLHYVRELLPAAIVVENVPDILNFGGTNVPHDICDHLKQLGYDCRYSVLNAAAYGVPQFRERLILIAVHKTAGRAPIFPLPTRQVNLPTGYLSSRTAALSQVQEDDPYYIEVPWSAENAPLAVTVHDALRDIPRIVSRSQLTSRKHYSLTDTQNYSGDPTPYGTLMREWFELMTSANVTAHVVRYTPRDFNIFRDMQAGEQYPQAQERALKLFKKELKKLRKAGKVLLENSAEYEALKATIVPPYDPGKFPNKWRKLYMDQPSWTLTAHLGKDCYSHIHYDTEQARTISVREAARLQSFPDAWIFNQGMNAALKQIGNAVPPLLAYAIANAVKESLALNQTPIVDTQPATVAAA